MKEIRLSLNQSQRIRLQAALQALEDLSKSNSLLPVTVSDIIPLRNEEGILKGHGTSERDGEVVATLCGVVERVNKLVYVRTLRARYKPEIGDIIVGRVVEIAPKRWKLEINFSQDAVLMLSSMNLPDGIQRRRTAIDELNMRSIFEENDVICAEVRSFQHDGSLQLQARSQKYGKLERGQLLTVPPYLVKRRKQHFHHLEHYKADLILGCNGFIWIGEHSEPRQTDMMSGQSVEAGQPGKVVDDDTFTSLGVRQNICRLANAIRVLASLGFTLSIEVILDTAELAASSNLEAREMLEAEFFVLISEREVERRKLLTKRKI